METIFLGIGRKVARGHQGLFDAVVNGITNNVGSEMYELIMANVTSICTDGTNENIGEKNSLWTLFKTELQNYRNDLPFIKLWCASHRSDLAWKNMADSVKEVRKILNELHRLHRISITQTFALVNWKKLPLTST